jgi:hypothetical protein
MDPKENTTEEMPFELSEQFQKAALERQIKMRERWAELEEEQPGPICEPDENGACDACSG